jgi:nitrogen regulatory protein PII
LSAQHEVVLDVSKDGVPAAVDRGAFFIAQMKKIECFLREADIQPILSSFSKTGLGGVTVYPVQGFGRQKGKGSAELLPKMKMEIFVLDMEVEYVLGTILQVTKKHDFGAGKIAVLPVDDVIRVRTGEKGAKAVF